MVLLTSGVRPPLLLLPLAALSNINCLQGDFVFDDSEAVVNNPDVVGSGSSDVTWADWGDLLRDDFWGTPLHKESSHGSFRPIITFIFRLMWQAGMMQANWFRLLNLVVHCIVTLNVHSILLTALQLPYNPLEKHARQAAFLAAVLFAIHPVHTESLCSAVGLADLLSGLFFIRGFGVYLRWIAEPRSRRLPIMLFGYAVLALFSKEPGVTLLGVCGAYELLVVCDIIPHHAITKYKVFVNSFKKSSLIRFGFCAVSGVSLVLIRCLIANFKAPTFLPMDNPASFLESPIERWVNYQYIYTLNLLLLFYPQWLCFDWSMGCVPLIRSALDPRMFSLIGLWAIAATLVRAAFMDDPPRRWHCIAISLLVMPFLPSSNLFCRVGFVLAERNLYLSSIGFCLFISIAMLQCHRNLAQHRKLQRFCLTLFILLLSGRSLRRSRDWRDERSLFNAGLDVCPLNAKVHYNIAKVAEDRDAAIASYRRALELNPRYEQAMNNLANILKDSNQLDEAKTLLETAVKIRTNFAAAWMNLGIVEAALKNFGQAELCYRKAIQHRNNRYPHCYFNLGNLYLEMQDHSRALTAYRTAVSQNPSHALSWNNMIILLDSLGRLPEAEEAAREALKRIRSDSVTTRGSQRSAIKAGSVAELEFHLANTLGKMERFKEAEEHFKKAIELKPRHASYYSNLGVLYHRWGRTEDAYREYHRALQYDPSNTAVKGNLAKLERARRRKR
ncbi:transmembrane and TPR repeat-containing protein 4-like [Varroa destructor]|uniref:dolichyl-phosphate-mannose--protein mannosyltransferase n=1 Tax=Varroa destructor TaxID=109461 RepID=A0A7M7KQN3_VARDE|nr:transmembrane and TPR repeat-containing protein 4-like [Varroa destructor]XP_022669241.1 transmembrane and TPR repeat-containing protein 4-like [Varroa destructor]